MTQPPLTSDKSAWDGRNAQVGSECARLREERDALAAILAGYRYAANMAAADDWDMDVAGPILRLAALVDTDFLMSGNEMAEARAALKAAEGSQT